MKVLDNQTHFVTKGGQEMRRAYGKNVSTIVSSLFLLLLSFQVYGAPVVLYDQPVQTNPGAFSNMGVGHQETADQFTLPMDSTITGIKWYGIYNGVDLAPAVTSLDFGIAFFSDSAGVPGTEIDTKIVSANVQDSGLTVSELGFHHGRVIYEFLADPFPNFVVHGGETIWLSIVEADPSTPPLLEIHSGYGTKVHTDLVIQRHTGFPLGIGKVGLSSVSSHLNFKGMLMLSLPLVLF